MSFAFSGEPRCHHCLSEDSSSKKQYVEMIEKYHRDQHRYKPGKLPYQIRKITSQKADEDLSEQLLPETIEILKKG